MRQISETRPCCCMVVGMHNSGTSLVGALLHAAGVPMGDRLLLRDRIEAQARPSYDYFEDEDVVALQDATLVQLQRHWSSYRSSLPLPEADIPARVEFRQQLAQVFMHRLKRQRLWLVKDPRTAILLNDWLNVLADLDIQAKLLIVHRDPIGNIHSFSSKGRVPPLWAEALWQRTYTNILEASKTLPHQNIAMACFSELMDAPEREARRLCRFMCWEPSEQLIERVASRFDPNLSSRRAAEATETCLHPATLWLQHQLSSAETHAGHDPAPQLLADQIAATIARTDAPLELNRLFIGRQTLLPKTSVTIVTAELQGWELCGGIGSAYLELALALAAAGHAVRVLLVAAGKQDPSSVPAGLSVERLDPSGLSRLELCREIANHLRARPCDVVHLHEWLGLGSGLKAALGSGGPMMIVGLHGPSAWTRSGNPWPRDSEGGLLVSPSILYEEGLVRALELDTIAQADLLVSPSRFMAQWVQDHLCADQPACAVAVQSNAPLSGTRIRCSYASSSRTLIYLGRLEQRKGLLLFLESLKHLSQPPEQVIFIGGDCQISETCLGSELAQASLATLGIPCCFHSQLQRDQALQLVKELGGVIVIPSLIENSPCVVDELLDSNLRMVTTNVGGISELVSSSCRHWLSETEPLALAQHLHAALEISDPNAYRLTPQLPPWQITLSWQAFHERLPHREPCEVFNEQVVQPTTNLLRRGLRLGKDVTIGSLRRLGLWRS